MRLVSTESILRPLLVLALAVSCDSREADGELQTPGEVRFEVRPLGGPGTMGPLVVSPASEPALAHVRSYLNGHPEAGRLRIECSVSSLKMSSTPNPAWSARLARQIARKLVAQGIDCKRLEPVGLLDPADDAPAERVRFFVGEKRQPRPDEARLDPCEDR